MPSIISHLEHIIASRRESGSDDSYVACLTRKGRAHMAQKLGEESVEAVIAAMKDDHDEMTGEAADLVFHLLVLLADMEISWDEVMAELARREGTSGLVEKAARTQG